MPLLLGTSNFEKIIDNNGYFVDKTLLIKDLIDDGSEVTLLPRPRRFGKTLNLSMLQYFFEKHVENTKGNKHLFKNLKIMKEDKKYQSHLGQYPIIFLTFKDVKEATWNGCFEKLQNTISSEFERHSYLLEKNILNDSEKIYFKEITERKNSSSNLSYSLKTLSNYLQRFYNQKVIILIDEYDMPLTTGYANNYYTEIRDFIRNLLSGALKDNSSLERGVLTGILRVAKESIFSGLNNPLICTIMDDKLSSHFGFTEEEVSELLKYYNINTPIETIRQWYNGYIFGETLIYNPWSIVTFIKKDGLLANHWVNTSSNDIIRDLITTSHNEIKEEFENLLHGGSVTAMITDTIVYDDIEEDYNVLWGFLLFCGYLKVIDKKLVDGEYECKLIIPNNEVKNLFTMIIKQWFTKSIKSKKVINEIENALTSGDIKFFTELFQTYVENSFSYFDVQGETPEEFYHAFVLGIMVTFRDSYEIRSNRESGYGRYDVMLIPRDRVNHYGIIFEFKRKRPSETLEEALESGMKQIIDKNYKQELLSFGIKNIREIAIAFEGKKSLLKWQ